MKKNTKIFLPILVLLVLVVATWSGKSVIFDRVTNTQEIANTTTEDGIVANSDVSVSSNYYVEPLTDANTLAVASDVPAILENSTEDGQVGTAMPDSIDVTSTETDYYIATLEQFNSFQTQSQSNTFAGCTVHLAANIELDGEFAGIGSLEVPFAGTFDGHGYSITKLSSTTNGLFVAVEGATIRNLAIGNAKIAMEESDGNVGVLVGRANGATVENVVIASSKITTPVAETSELGGMIGYVNGAVTISNSEIRRLTIRTAGMTCGVGGFVGLADASVRMQNCNIANSYVRNTLATKDGHMAIFMGGVVGYATAPINATEVSATAMNLQVASPVKGMGTIAGRLTGEASSFDRCSVDVSTLTMTTGEDIGVGGFVGWVETSSSFTNSYVSNAKVNAKGNGYGIGGFIGNIETVNPASITSCLVNNVTVSGKTWVGEVIGKDKSSNTIVNAVYYYDISVDRADNAEIYLCENIVEAMIEAMSSGELAWNLNTVNGTVANSKVWSQGNVPRFDTEATEATVRVAFIQPSGTTYCYTDGKGNVVQPELDENYFWSGGTYFVEDTSVEAIIRDLFYQNRGTVQGADPCVITIGDTFYLYATNATEGMDCSNIRVWSSKDLNEWTEIGNAFVPAEDAWAVNSLWAPEVVAANGQYYMYYSGYNRTTGVMGVGVAVSQSPTGPFYEIEGQFGGKTYSRTEQPIDLGYPIIDPNPFIDDDGSVYLYVAQDQVNNVSSIFGCKLSSDMVTVESVTEEALVVPLNSEGNSENTKYWNEAPCMYKRDGKYYLLFSTGYYQSKSYCLGVATSDKPLSGFTRVNYNPVLIASSAWDYVSGTGHCSLFPSPDGTELWMAYHSHVDVENGGSQRKINFDKTTFDASGRFVVSGPSVTPQVLPSGVSNYGNIASEATVSATQGGKVSLLTDGIVNYRTARASTYEYSSTGTNTITLTFSKARNIAGIMIYDSSDLTVGGNNVAVTVGADSYNMTSDSSNIPGTASILEINETKTDKVTLTFVEDVKVSEIVILGEKEWSFGMTTNYFTETSDGVYTLTMNSVGDGGVDDVKRGESIVREAYYGIKGKVTLDTNANWTQARILVSSDPNNEHIFAIERTDGTNYQVFAMSKDNEEVWNDWRLLSHAAVNGTDNSIDFEVIANGRQIYFLIDDEICYTSDRVSMTESTVKFSCAVNTGEELATATTIVENLDGQIFRNAKAVEEYLGTKNYKTYESAFQAQIDARYNEYFVDNNCSNKGGTLILGHSHVDPAFWGEWENQAGLTKYVNGFNVGIGGTTTLDWLHAYDKLVKPFNAEKFVISVGENDVRAWGRDGAEVVESLSELFAKIHADHPNSEIYYIYSLPAEAKYANGQWLDAEYKALVEGEKVLCDSLDYVTGVDTFSVLVDASANNVKTELFGANQDVHLNAEGYQVWSNFLYDNIFKGENFGVTVGEGVAYKTTNGIKLEKDKGDAPTIEMFGGAPRYAYLNDTYSDKLYFETEITVKEVLNNDAWPKFGIILNGKSESLKFFVDMTAEMTATTVGVVHQPTNGGDDWANVVSANVDNMRFTNGDKIRLGVIRDGNAYYFYVNGALVLTEQNVFIDDKSAVGIFAFNTVLTASGYTSFQGENFGAVIEDGYIYKTTMGIDLANDRGETPTIQVNEGGPRYAYLKDVYSDQLYFETEFNVSQVLNNDAWPKFGIILNGKTESLKFFVDMTAEMTATNVGVVRQPRDGADDWANVVSANVDNMRFTNGDKVRLAVIRDGGTYYFYVNDVLVITRENAFADDKSAVGIFAFNTVLTASGYTSLQGENFGITVNEGMIYRTTTGIDLANDKGANPTIQVHEGGPRYAYLKDIYSDQLYFEAEFNVSHVLNNDAWPKFGIILNGKTESLKFFVDMTAEMTATNVGVVRQPRNGDDDWANVVSANVDNMKFTNGDKIKLAVIRDGNAYYFYVNGALVLTEENIFADNKSAVGIFAFNTVLTASNYTVLKDDAVTEKIATIK